MPVREALEFFANQPKIARILQTLDSVGMGYVRLGQPATTLSGGEAQRIKLSRELARPSTGRTLYILDEPTTGLHFADVNRLIDCLQQLVDHGNTAVVIEHNLEMIKVADHVIDLGPEGGEGGGQVVYQGDFEGFLQQRSSHTAKALREFLNPQSIPTVRKRFSRKPRAHGHSIQVRGAHKNNLKRIDVDIPHQQMTVVTGVSGSGKSSLVFDILFAEGQRRFVESLSTYARRFISRLGRASVDTVSGLAPAIAIDQKRATRNPRSTVATATEIYDYLRLLYARLGTEHCLTCDRQLTAHTPARAARDTVARWDGQRISILAPMFLPNCPSDLLLSRISDLKKLAPKLLADGYARVEIAGVVHRLDEPLPRRIPRKRPIYLVIDRVRASHKSVARLAEAFEAAYALSGRYAGVRPEGQEALHYSAHFGCTDCFYQPDQALHPRMFSFNSWEGACNHCGGLGWIRRVALERIVANPELPLLGGALTAQVADALRDIAPSVARQLRGFPLQQKLLEERPFRKLTARQRSAVWEGDPLRHRACELNAPVWPGLEGLVAEAFSHLIWGGGEPLQHFYHEASCTQCAGDRLQPRQRAVRVAGQSIAEFCRLRIDHALEFLEQEVRFRGRRARIAEQILSELTNRLTFLLDVGLSYLTLDRRAATLSGGESQRIRLATQIGNRLVGVLYCLDEPTVGLHPRDTDQLLSALERLRDLGNTIVLVEHDLETIRRADHTIDLGPGAGELGGQVVASGTPAAISRKSSSLTGRYLAGKASITRPAKRRAGNGQRLTVLGASLHNLKLDVHLPLGTLTVVSGVSGSGKSSLIIDTLVPAVDRVLRLGVPGPGPYREIHGLDQIQRMQVIDQDPIGTTPRSSPATYLGMMGPIRDLFAATRLSRAKGFTKRRFSYNVAEGQCAACQGKGAQVIEMHFLSDVWVQCVECNGQRFNKETLQVRWRGLTIADMLALSVSEALPVFENQHRIVRTLTLLDQVGLEYLRLGQGLDTLSGGEAQRVKLSAELSPTGRACPTLFVMDEPTTGLHLEDVRKLLLVLQDLVDNGHSVLVVEHHPDVIAAADWLIDLGPEAGHGGGQLVAAGAPEEVAASPASHTGRVLREILSS